MRIVSKYYDKSGRAHTVYLHVTSKGQVHHLKEAVHSLLHIPLESIQLTIQNAHEQIHLSQDSQYLSHYQLTADSLLLIQKKQEKEQKEQEQEKEQKQEQEYEQELTQSEHSMDLELVYRCVQENDLELLKTVPLEPGVINDTRRHPWSALHLCVFNGFEKMYLWLAQQGADLSKESQDGWTCLQLAVWQRNVRMVTLVVASQQVDVNQCTKKGTALHLAAQSDDPEILQILLGHPKINLKQVFPQRQLKHPRLHQPETCRRGRYHHQTTPHPRDGQAALSVLPHPGVIQVQHVQPPQTHLPVPEQLLRQLPTASSHHQGQGPQSQLFQTYAVPKVHDNRSPVWLSCEVQAGSRHPLPPEVNDLAYYFTHSSIIALETINDIKLSKDRWFFMPECHYIEIQYANNMLYIGLLHKNTARQWYESLRNAVGYSKYIQNRINEKSPKLEKNIVQLMMQYSNQEIEIKDDNHLHQQLYLQDSKKKKKFKYQQSLDSVTEIDQEDFLDLLQNEPTLRIQDFQILDHIGKGSFGNVYKALLQKNGTLYALKQQDKSLITNEGQLNYILAELQILKKLNHQFLVKLHHAFQTPKYLYLVLDYYPQGDLSKYITRGVILDEFTAKFYISQVILALEYLHKKNIIYRDLKPENILLADDGYIKLIDFGLAKEGDSEDFIASSFCGSPAYLSPEILAGQGTCKATDIYSIGTILYEMLTGYPPYYCSSLKDLLNNIRYQKLTFPQGPNSKISAQAKNLLTKLLDRDPDARLGAKNISVVKKHIYFTDINWEKIEQKKYIAPKLKLRKEIYYKKQQQKNIPKINFDEDYNEIQFLKNEVKGWNF